MSTVNCGACSDLRESAANFVQNGVTSAVADSLADNTGFNPNLSVLHDNCTDLNLANDCLIGFMEKDLKAYDVCDWKDFMKKFLRNLYELLKAFIASMCGLWDRVEASCETQQMLIDFAVQDVTRLDGTIVSNHLTKNVDSAHVSIHAATKSAKQCDGKKAVFDLVKISMSGGFSTSSLAENEVIATWDKSTLVPNYMHESTFNSIMSNRFMQLVATTADGKALFCYIGSNSNYSNKMCMVVNSIVGPSRTSTAADTYTNQTAIRTFRIS